MIEIPSDIAPHDISQWLDGGVFFAKPPGGDDWKLASYAGTGDGREVAVRWISTGGGDYVPLSDVRAHWPTCGSINMPEFALYVQRMQRRQWRRTFNGRCVRLSVPGKWQLLKSIEARNLRVSTDDPTFLNAVFNPTYPNTLDDAMRELQEKPSVALSPQVLLVGHPNPVVYYRGERVGQMLGSKFQDECNEMVALRVNKLIGVAA